MKKKKQNKKTELKVDDFWDTHDATKELDLSPNNQVQMVYEPAVESISLRLPVPLLTKIKQTAAHMDIAYQALIKIWLAQKAKEEARAV